MNLRSHEHHGAAGGFVPDIRSAAGKTEVEEHQIRALLVGPVSEIRQFHVPVVEAHIVVEMMQGSKHLLQDQLQVGLRSWEHLFHLLQELGPRELLHHNKVLLRALQQVKVARDVGMRLVTRHAQQSLAEKAIHEVQAVLIASGRLAHRLHHASRFRGSVLRRPHHAEAARAHGTIAHLVELLQGGVALPGLGHIQGRPHLRAQA
mmetsp:Transcript_130662/g.279380  ORF Transcript_130662/g.279380 Transcript_130662/m.279380 type:complete len:205 (+) Transcript_130662:624-1238(+)